MLKPGSRNLITDVDGLLVGNAHDARLRSGVTRRAGRAAVRRLGRRARRRAGHARDRPARSLLPGRPGRCDLPVGRLGLWAGVGRWRDALAARARPRLDGRRRGRADRAGRDPVRPAERRRQGLGLAALSRACLPRGRRCGARLRARQCRRRHRREGGRSEGRFGQRLDRRSGDRPAGRGAGRGQCARLHDHGRHAAVLGLGAGAGGGVRRSAAARAWPALEVSHNRADLTHDPADAARSDPRANTTIAVVATNARLDKARRSGWR